MNYKNEHKDFKSYALATTKNATASIGSKINALLPFNVSGASLSALRTSINQNPGTCITVGAAVGFASCFLSPATSFPDSAFFIPALSGGTFLGFLSSLAAHRAPWKGEKAQAFALCSLLGGALTTAFYFTADYMDAQRDNALAAREQLKANSQTLTLQHVTTKETTIADAPACEMTWINPTTGKTNKAIIFNKCIDVFAPK